MHVRHGGVVLAATVAAVVLAGCSSGSGYADLSPEATSRDGWPTDLPEYSTDSVDEKTSRFVGEYEGSELYLARSIEPQEGVCLLAYTDGSDWVVGCGPSGLRVSASSERTFAVLGDGATSEDLQAISTNVFVIKR